MSRKSKNSAKVNPIDELKKRLIEISHLGSAIAILDWDQQVNMPEKGAQNRAVTMGHLSSVVHKRFVDIDNDKLLSNLVKDLETKKFSEEDKVIIRETWRNYERSKKLPDDFVRAMTETTAQAHAVWAQARKKSDFKVFLPWLKKIIELKRKEADYVGYENSPYDALIDVYEPGMTADEAAKILNDLKDFLVPFLAKIQSGKKKETKDLKGDFPVPLQFEFNRLVAEKMGYDLQAGRIDVSTHPFTTGFHPADVRFTTRYDKNDVSVAVGSTVHEAGHALYEQGLQVEYFGTPIGESISLGIHESQSRMWENMIGKSLEFWKYFYPKLQKIFPKPFNKIKVEEFYRALNRVEPSFIRVEADEVTYNLHIIIRFELERELIEGTIAVEDLPQIWNEKVKKYLGLTVPKDVLGVLQDVHWSAGLFGYFPTYSFGNLYAAQFYNAMKKDIPDISKRIAKGDLKTIREWLRKKIHTHGKLYTADSLAKKISGESLNSKHFIDYLTQKYTA